MNRVKVAAIQMRCAASVEENLKRRKPWCERRRQREQM